MQGEQYGFENHNSFCDQCSNSNSTIDYIIDLVKESQLKNKDNLLYDTSKDTFMTYLQDETFGYNWATTETNLKFSY